MPNHEYYVKHREQYRKYQKEHPPKNTDKRKAQRHEYWRKNRARFHEYYLKNRERKLQYMRNYARDHAEKIRQRARKHHSTPGFKAKNLIRGRRVYDERRKWLFEIKKDLECSVCGLSFPDFPNIIDFHHEGRESKETAIGTMIRTGTAKKTILKEIEKCIPVCANCHRKLHNAQKKPETKYSAGTRRYQQRHWGWWVDMKKNLQCSICGQSFPDCPSIMDFHHGGGRPKEAAISTMIRGRLSKEAILAEVSKCVPVCANCHRRLHESERQKKKGSVPVPELLADDYPEQWGFFR